MRFHRLRIGVALVASMASMPSAATAQTKYYARAVVRPLTSSAATAPAPQKTCAPGDHDSWTYLMVPGAGYGNYASSGAMTKVGSAQDRSPALQTICAAAIAGSSRSRCALVGQGGYNVDVYIAKQDADFPIETIERDNAIVYEVISCS